MDDVEHHAQQRIASILASEAIASSTFAFLALILRVSLLLLLLLLLPALMLRGHTLPALLLQGRSALCDYSLLLFFLPMFPFQAATRYKFKIWRCLNCLRLCSFQGITVKDHVLTTGRSKFEMVSATQSSEQTTLCSLSRDFCAFSSHAALLAASSEKAVTVQAFGEHHQSIVETESQANLSSEPSVGRIAHRHLLHPHDHIPPSPYSNLKNQPTW